MPIATSEESELMNRFGITKVPKVSYHYKAWRYSNLEDALAQATRDLEQMKETRDGQETA